MGKQESLENLLRSGSLKAEPPDRQECEGLMRSAMDRLTDAQTVSLSFASRFDWRTTPPMPPPLRRYG